MVHGNRIDIQLTPGGSYTSCFLTAAAAAKQADGVQCNGGLELSEQLGRLIPQFTKETKYISSINEPWATTAHAADDFFDYVEAFSYILDAAEDHNLQVISPTVRKGRGEDQEAWWLAQFLGACEADSTFECDIEAIHAWDLHNYNCKASKWEGLDSFMAQMKDDLVYELTQQTHAFRTEADWRSYVNARPVWVTEVSCNHEGGDPVDNVGSCKRNAEQHTDNWGDGVIKALDRTADVERWAWWTTFRVNTTIEPHTLAVQFAATSQLLESFAVGWQLVVPAQWPLVLQCHQHVGWRQLHAHGNVLGVPLRKQVCWILATHHVLLVLEIVHGACDAMADRPLAVAESEVVAGHAGRKRALEVKHHLLRGLESGVLLHRGGLLSLSIGQPDHLATNSFDESQTGIVAHLLPASFGTPLHALLAFVAVSKPRTTFLEFLSRDVHVARRQSLGIFLSLGFNLLADVATALAVCNGNINSLELTKLQRKRAAASHT